MSETRERVADYVRAHPGVHFNAVVRALDLAPGQVQYHVNVLLGGDAFVAEQLYGRTHYYPDGYDAWERHALALLRRETARDVVAVLLDADAARPGAVADELDVARSTLEWHLDRLVEHDLVTKDRDDRGRVTLALARPEATVRLLHEADPALGERMVDRFTRLVDRLLSE
jgi:predicted transcriptional regulator